MEVFADGVASEAWPAEEGGAPPLATLPEAPGVTDNTALIRAMLKGETFIPEPLLRQVEALAGLARA